jgi:hypothetical protein
MRYEPRRDEMTREERRFLDLVAPSGLDWLTTRNDFARRHGVTNFYDFAQVVALPASDALSESPLTFHMYAEPSAMDLPPEYVFAYFMPHDNARKNHREIERQLEARLGRPKHDDTSNCISRRWTFGVFSVELHTFPPEKQDPVLLRSNVLDQREPRFVTASSINLKSDYAHVYPDGSLNAVAALIDAARSSTDDGAVLRLPLVESRLTREPRSIRHSRRNPRSLEAALVRGSAVAWVDEIGGRIGLSTRFQSLVFERTPSCSLVLVRIAPARGPGGAELELQTGPSPGPYLGHKVRAELRSCGPTDSLDATADQLARFWNVPLIFESSYDE